MLPPPREPAAETLHFSCRRCATPLEVPAAMAGVSGPCPVCRAMITAPAWQAGDFLVVPEARPAAPAPAPSQPAPAPALPEPLPTPPTPAAAAPLPTVPADPAPAASVPAAPEPSVSPWHRLLERSPQSAPASRQTVPVAVASAAETEPAEPAQRAVRPGRHRRSAWLHAADLLLVACFTAALLTAAAALAFAHPRQLAGSTVDLPANLTQLIAREQDAQKVRRAEAVALARACVRRFLEAPDDAARAALSIAIPEGFPAAEPLPMPSGLSPEDMTASGIRRIPETDRYVVTLTAEPAGPAFIVEETAEGPRLHTAALAQQLLPAPQGAFGNFLAHAGEGTLTAYALVRPAEIRAERAYRSSRPDLGRWQMLDVMRPFPGKSPDALIACLDPSSEAGRQFALRAHEPEWRPALVRLEWRTNPASGPWAEITAFLPSAWSGNPPPSGAVATTASLR